MARTVAVDDPADPRLEDYRHLTDAVLRRRIEAPGTTTTSGRHDGLFIAEGVAVIRRLLASRYRTRSVLVTAERLAALEAALAPVDTVVYVGSLELLRAVAGFDLHRGAVAAADRLPPVPWIEVVATAGTVTVLEGLNDHENLGAVARSALGLGIDALLLDPTCADPLYRRSVRVSMGAVLHLPTARLNPWPDVLADLAREGFTTVALTPGPNATPIDDVEVPPGQRIALLLGAEGPGLSPAVLAAADVRVCIPLAPGADSLNVGHAAAIAFHRFGLTRR